MSESAACTSADTPSYSALCDGDQALAATSARDSTTCRRSHGSTWQEASDGCVCGSHFTEAAAVPFEEAEAVNDDLSTHTTLSDVAAPASTQAEDKTLTSSTTTFAYDELND